MVRTTHLEIVSADQWVRRAREAMALDVRECVVKQPRLNRFLYEYVGADWKWTERLAWPAQRWHDYAANDNLRTFIAYRQGSITGYYELQQQAGGSVEIRIFGLTPEFIGQGLGGPLLDSAIENAFAWGARRVWVHTCTDDHPNALNNYRKSGFTIFKVEDKPPLSETITLADDSRNIDLIVTDLGGTLVKTDDAILAAVHRAAKELGIPEGHPDPVYDVFGTSIWEYIHAWLPAGHKDRADECHECFWELFPHSVLDGITPFDGVEAALADLKARGVRLAVLSGLRIESIEEILETLRFRDWDAVRSSMMYETQAGDSRARGIVMLVEEFGVALGRTIYIGDTDHDVRQAKKAGVLSAVVKTGGQAVKHLDKIEAENPHHLLRSFSDLRTII